MEELYRLHHAPLLSFAKRLMGRPAAFGAEDVAGETILRAIEGVQRYDGSVSLLAWMKGIALKVHHKQRKRERVTLQEAALFSMPSEGMDPAIEIEHEDVARKVSAIMGLLPDHHAEVLRLRYVEGVGGHDIAARLGLTLHATHSLLARARASFRAAAKAGRLRVMRAPAPAAGANPVDQKGAAGRPLFEESATTPSPPRE